MKITQNIMGRRVRMVNDGRRGTIVNQGSESITVRLDTGTEMDIYCHQTPADIDFLEYIYDSSPKVPLHVLKGRSVTLLLSSDSILKASTRGTVESLHVSVVDGVPTYFVTFDDGREAIFNDWESIQVIEYHQIDEVPKTDNNEARTSHDAYTNALSLLQSLSQKNNIHILVCSDGFQVWTKESDDEYEVNNVDDVIECVKALSVLNKWRQ